MLNLVNLSGVSLSASPSFGQRKGRPERIRKMAGQHGIPLTDEQGKPKEMDTLGREVHKACENDRAARKNNRMFGRPASNRFMPLPRSSYTRQEPADMGY
jgi:hypothetical protein